MITIIENICVRGTCVTREQHIGHTGQQDLQLSMSPTELSTPTELSLSFPSSLEESYIRTVRSDSSWTNNRNKPIELSQEVTTITTPTDTTEEDATHKPWYIAGFKSAHELHEATEKLKKAADQLKCSKHHDKKTIHPAYEVFRSWRETKRKEARVKKRQDYIKNVNELTRSLLLKHWIERGRTEEDWHAKWRKIREECKHRRPFYPKEARNQKEWCNYASYLCDYLRSDKWLVSYHLPTADDSTLYDDYEIKTQRERSKRTLEDIGEKCAKRRKLLGY